MDDVHLADWYAGVDTRPVEAYRIFEPAFADLLGVRAGSPVWLSDYTLTKTSFRHKEIEFADYVRLPEILTSGFVCPANKQRSLEVVHADLRSEHFRFWRVCIKGTQGDAAFVTMFHRSHLKDVRRIYRRAMRRGRLLRDHKDEPVRLLLSRTGTVT